MASLLDEVVREAAPPPPQYASVDLDKETRIAQVDLRVVEDDAKVGSPSAYSCPDCGGVLWEIEEHDFLRFRCRVGHSYSALALADEQNESLEKSLWAGFRALEETSAFARRQAVRARRSGNTALAERFMARAEEASMNAEGIREMIVKFNDMRAAKT
jgi:two-component system chemotaxis response regulator CheB